MNNTNNIDGIGDIDDIDDFFTSSSPREHLFTVKLN